MINSQLHKTSQIRFRRLNDVEVNTDGTSALYLMQRSLRTDWNLTLELAIAHANELDCGLIVAFPFSPAAHMPTRRQGHYVYQILPSIKKALDDRSIKFNLYIDGYEEICKKLAPNAKVIYTEKAYLKENRKAREFVAQNIDVPIIEVEDNIISPVEKTSDKEEYAARTIRKKIEDSLALDEVTKQSVEVNSLHYPMKGDELIDVDSALDRAGFSDSTKPVSNSYASSEKEAQDQFQNWLDTDYYDYDEYRSDPNRDSVSHMSVALHFGLISPHYVVNKMSTNRGKNKKAFLEELIVRRELAYNFAYFNRTNYDSFQSLPEWAQETLEEHKSDDRRVYTKKELLEGKTHDDVWNQCMNYIVDKGYLHNHLRMYWGKKLLEYTNTPSFAFEVALEFNNTYFLDGNNPNSFANVAWIFGKHDRAFGESKVFGKVRPMSRSGLDRKFKVEEWME